MTDSALNVRVRERLLQLSANDLQMLAEDMACIKLERRFQSGTLIRNGRNDEGQTTKNWPDAFVLTEPNAVDGIEATRDRQGWQKHLKLRHLSAQASLNRSVALSDALHIRPVELAIPLITANFGD